MRRQGSWCAPPGHTGSLVSVADPTLRRELELESRYALFDELARLGWNGHGPHRPAERCRRLSAERCGAEPWPEVP